MNKKKINPELAVNQKNKSTLRTVEYNYHPVKFRKDITSYKIELIPIDEIYYRFKNHRLICSLEECISNSKGRFTMEILMSDTRRKEVQDLIENALCSSIGEDIEELEYKLMNEFQTIPLILTKGYIVANGNSRLFIMRKLYKLNPIKFAHFKMVRCVFLPEDATEEEIDEYEIQEQIEPEVKINYKWYATARWMSDYKKSKKKNNKEVAEKFRQPKAEVIKLMNAYEEGLIYLEYIGKPFQYRYIELERSALEALHNMKKKWGNEPDRQKFAEILCYHFLTLPSGERPERLSMYFSRIGNYLDSIEKDLSEFGPVANELSKNSRKWNEEKDEIDALFGGEENVSNTEKLLILFENMEPKKQGQVRALIDKVIDIEKIKTKDKEMKLIPEMELRQAIDHLNNSICHYSGENPKNVINYLDEIMKLSRMYLKQVRNEN